MANLRQGIGPRSAIPAWCALLALCALGAGRAEALTYSWMPSSGSYTAVTGPTLAFSPTDNAATFVTLPFTFSYDSIAYSSLAVSTNGMVSFGSSSTSTLNSDLFTTFSPFSVLAPWWDDQIDDLTATVQTFTEGLSPNRVFVIQYGDYPDWATGSSLRLQYQVRLSEGTNRIQFVYGAKSAGTSHPSSSASIGIKGRNSLPGFFFEGTRGSRTAGLSNLTSATGFPAEGMSFTFAPDTVAPTGLVAVPGNGRADLTWMKSRLPTLMRYRIYIGASPTTMALWDSTAALSDTTFSITGLVNGTTYYVGVTGVGPGLEESGFAQVVSVIPTQPPTVAVASPASGTMYPSTTTGIPFTATASDPDGSIVRVEYYRGAFLIGSSTVGSSYSVTWFSPSAGTHSVTARAFDNTGASTVSAPITITVNAAPIVTMTGPVSGSRFDPGTLVTLSASASDGDGTVTVVEFLQGGVKIGEDSTSPYAYDWSAGPTGNHSITARAIDNSGETRVSTGITVIVTLPPQVTLITPTTGTVVNAGTAIQFSSAATDNDGTVGRVEYYRGTTFIGSSFAGNPFSYNWPSAIAGTHSITARAFDNLGIASTSDPVTLIVNALPTVSVTAPATGTVILPGSDALLSAAANDGDGTVSRVEFYRDGILIGDDSSAPYGLTWASPPPGRYLVTARAYDNLGAVGTSLSTVLIVTHPPVVRFTNPVNGGAIGYPQAQLTATATDNDGTIGRVDFYRGSSLVGSSSSGNPFSIFWTVPLTGTHTLIARAYDNYGAASLPDTVVVTTSSLPQVALTGPSHFSAFATSGSIALTATASDPDGSVSEVRFYRDSIFIGSSTGPSFGTTWTNVPPGRYRLQARAVDNLGLIGYSQGVTVFVNDSSRAILGGRLFVTGHDADNHVNLDFMSAALDYLIFGKAAGPLDLPIKKGARIAFLGDISYPTVPILAYAAPTYINVSQPGWDTLAFPALPYDVLMVGTGLDYLSRSGSSAVNAQRAKFEEYFNHGGGILASSEQGIGQSYYSFLPSFATATQQNIGDVQGQFTVTPAGLAIGLTEEIVDRDLTHTEFRNVDTTVFRIFEFYNADLLPVSIGANAVIDGDIFIPRDSVVADPQAFSRDDVFVDTLCIRFESSTPGAVLHLTRDGGDPDTSTWTLANGSSVCIDNTTRFRVIAKRTGWVSSAVKEFQYRRADHVAVPIPDIPAGYFRDRICVRFTSATPGAAVHYTLDGGRPDTSSLVKANGDSVCLEATSVIRVLGRHTGMRDSDTASHAYTRMQQAAMPTLDKPDSTGFGDSLCFRFSAATSGSHIHYTLDGGNPDTAETHAHDGDSLCVDRSVTVRLMAERMNFIPSDVNTYRYFRMNTVAIPISNRADSTRFRDTLCLTLTTATPGAAIHYTLDGSLPDSASPVAQAGGLCVDRTVQVQAMAVLLNWINSPVSSYAYPKMDTVAKPVPDPGDSTYFPQSLCVRWTVATPGAVIHVTADGTRPDSASRTLASGDTLCLDRTATVRAVGAKPDWIPSPDTAATFVRMIRAAKPTADQPDSLYYPDRLCIRYRSATEGVRIHYTLDGGKADTSSLSIANGDTLCVDRTVHVEAVSAHHNWIPSEVLALDFFRMQTVATPMAGVPDSTWFRDSLCVPWTVATAGAAIKAGQTPLDADGRPAVDEAHPAHQVLVSGDSVCLDRSATLRAVGSLVNWKDSPEAVRSYFRMDTVAAPVFDRRDTVFYPSICVAVSTPTPGAQIRYTLDGGDPDTSRLIKQGTDTICTDRSALIRAVGERKNSVSSAETGLRLVKMPQVAPIISSIGDSAVFARRICFTLSSSTDSVRIRYTLGGGDPLDDTLFLANGDSLCLDRSADLVAVGSRPLWRDSETLRVSLEVDNDGPRLVAAEKRPYDIRNASVTGNCRGIGQDTLVATFNEPLFPKSKPPRWDRLLVFSPSCDSAEGLPVLPFGDPVISGDGLKATFLLDNAAPDEKPKLGNCLSLDWRSGEFPDRVGNLPGRHGIRIEGRENAVRISQIRAYPPVVGLDNAGTSGGCSDERVEVNTWIPPVGFNIVRGDIDPGLVRNCLERGGESSGRRMAIPPCLSIVEVVSDGPYVADINIFDNLGNFIHGSRQSFGVCGELDNLDRSVAGKQRSYLVWNSRDRTGARAGNGVYVWRIAFHSEKHGMRGTQTVLLRTGILRTGACAQ